MDYTTWKIPAQPAVIEGEKMPIRSLYEALQELTDPRRAQGKRYSLALILCLVVLAKLAGQKTAAAERPNGFVIVQHSWCRVLKCVERRCRAR